MLECWISLLADSPLNKSHGRKPKRVISTFKKEVLNSPLLDTIVHYTTLADQLVITPTSQGEGSITGTFIEGMKDTPIFKEYLTWFNGSGDPGLYKYLMTFLTYGKKMEYDDESLKQIAFRDWQRVEERLSGLSLDSEIIAGLKTVMRSLIPKLPIGDLRASYGPGTVFEKDVRSIIDKTEHLTYDAKLDRAFFKSHFVNYGLGDTGHTPDRTIPSGAEEWRKAKRAESISEVVMIYKNIKTARSICKEENVFMFFQQAYRRHMNILIRRGPANRFIHLEDQRINQQLSLYGSITGLLDTIDLKAASDSVSLDLVKGIFPREVLYFLLGTRSSKVKTPNGVIAVKKFAPMGSAVCFPTQCLVFTAIVIYAGMIKAYGVDGQYTYPQSFWDEHVSPSSIRDLFRKEVGWARSRYTFEPLSVYGDDIVCDSKLTPIVIHLLGSLGFEINTSKSFTGGQSFRESCGAYWYNGEDVTPLQYRVKSGGLKDPRVVASLVEAVNRTGDYRYTTVYRVLLSYLRSGRGKVSHLLFSNNRDNSMAIYHEAPTNDHLARRFNVDWQREEIRSFQFIDKVVRGRDGLEFNLGQSVDKYRYNQWWISAPTVLDSSEVRYQAKKKWGGVRGDSRLRWRWTPIEV